MICHSLQESLEMDLCDPCKASIPMRTWTCQALAETEYGGGRHANRKTRTKEGGREGFKTFHPTTKSAPLKHFIDIYTPLSREKNKQTARNG